MRRWAWLLALPLVAACSGGSEPSADAGFTDDAGADAGVVDTGVAAGSYAHVAPTLGAVPEVLKGETWLTHHTQDILPYWDMPEAFGTPEGNFPTYRGMNGTIQGSNERRPRMIARQTFAYAVAYMLHGDPRHLELAHAGAQWIMDHAADARPIHAAGAHRAQQGDSQACVSDLQHSASRGDGYGDAYQGKAGRLDHQQVCEFAVADWMASCLFIADQGILPCSLK